jgi:cytidylate kinase
MYIWLYIYMVIRSNRVMYRESIVIVKKVIRNTLRCVCAVESMAGLSS